MSYIRNELWNTGGTYPQRALRISVVGISHEGGTGIFSKGGHVTFEIYLAVFGGALDFTMLFHAELARILKKHTPYFKCKERAAKSLSLGLQTLAVQVDSQFKILVWLQNVL